MSEPQTSPPQIAIVTGAGKRIGRAIALDLARYGWDIAVHYGSSEDEANATADEIREIGRKAIIVQADLTEPELAAKTIVSETADRLGTPTLLVNSAAVFIDAPLDEVTGDHYASQMAINLAAPMFLCREFVARLPQQLRGQIVNIIDWRVGLPSATHLVYQMSKAGLWSLTQTLARQLGPQIRVNAVAPGPILPPPGEDESHFDPIVPTLPLKTHGHPQDIASAVRFLTENAFVTGEMIHVTGGQHLVGE